MTFSRLRDSRVHGQAWAQGSNQRGGQEEDADTASDLDGSSNHVWVPGWWVDYLHAAAEALDTRPRGDTIAAPTFQASFLRRASACSVCGERALESMERFTRLFSKEIENAISRVSLLCKLRRSSLLT